jgi:FkbM family methyltransferase
MNAGQWLYRALFALRHPKAVGLWRKGVDYDSYTRLDRAWLRRLDIRTVLDIGANEGQFARLIHSVLPGVTIYSFEPLPDCYQRLQSALPGATHFHAINCALGEANAEVEFLRSPHTPSSSFLPMTVTHERAYPESRGADRVKVRVRRLDDLAHELTLADNVFVKIDVQGYEGRVLRGGESTLRRCAVALVETSFVPLYRDQPLFAEVLARMQALGFAFFGNLWQHDDRASGCPLFADSLFVSERCVKLVVG